MHKKLKASRRYAKALLDFAEGQGKLDEIIGDMDVLREACSNNPDLVNMLHSPLIKPEKKLTILNKIFEPILSKTTMKFLGIIVSKRREGSIPGIAQSFREQVREHRGISLAEITTAVPLDSAQRSRLKGIIEGIYKKVELKEIIDPDIIAGFSIKVGDKLYDETIESRIKALTKYYRSNPYVSQL
jgi:F-type H+-transporting ATPase subunit delta